MVELWTNYLWPLIVMVFESVLLLVILLIVVAYILLADRKIWAAVQIRRGPNVVGPWGLLQSFADLLKFVVKEPIIPAGANKGLFLLAPLVTCVLALAAWAVIPVSAGWAIANINVGILWVFAISSLGVYGIIMAGWASNSKYPFLSALRSAAQMVSYEVSIGFVIITVLLCVGSLNPLRHRRRAGHPSGACSAGSGCRSFRCSSSSSSRRSPRPTGRRSTWSRPSPSSSPGSWSSTARRPTCCSCSANTSRSAPCARCARSCSWADGSRQPIPFVPFTWVPGVIWFVLQGVLRFLHVLPRERERAALSLRPVDAARLEGLLADLGSPPVALIVGRRAAIRRLSAGDRRQAARAAGRGARAERRAERRSCGAEMRMP